jgi:uncharacterized protein
MEFQQKLLLMKQKKPVIGMVHLAGLPGSANTELSLSTILDRAVREARVLAEAGFDAILFQNTGDVPAPEEGDESTIAYMTLIGQKIREACPVPLGVNVLMNGSKAALAIASAIGAEFIRIKICVGAVVTSTGIVQADPHAVLSFRNRIQAKHVSIWSDLYDRTSAPVGEYPLPVMADLALRHGGADALVISGYDVADCQNRLRTLRAAFPDAYLVTGGGANERNLKEFMDLSDSIIVGSSIKTGGHFLDPIDAAKANSFMKLAREIRGS